MKKNNQQLFSAVMTKPIKQQMMYRHILSGLERRDRVAGDSGTLQPQAPGRFASDFPLRLLVAEDNVINQQVILYILQKLGYEPTIVENGRLALEAATGAGDRSDIVPGSASPGGFDIILMDLQMPEMDGLEATRLIRNANLPHQPVIIALTANTMEGDEEECLRAGMDDYLGKPVKLEEVIGKLRHWALQRQPA
jgi:CheY-like chemotaxis protein